MKRWIRATLWVMLAAALTLTAARTLGDDVIGGQLDAMARSAGLTRTSYEMHRDWLHEGARTVLDFEAEAGGRYTIHAACDVDCLQLELGVRADDGSLAGSHEDANRPILSFEPRTDGRYELEAVMARCRIQPCQWGVRIYRR